MGLEERKKAETEGRKRTVIDLGPLRGGGDVHRGWPVAWPEEGCLFQGYLGIEQCL